MATYTSFEELDCYQKCRQVRIWISDFLKKSNIQDKDMIQNAKRAGRSTTRNIAEGFGRHHHKENMQFCRIARGSLHEILDDLSIGVDENLSTEQIAEEGKTLTYQVLKSLNGYIAYLDSILKNNLSNK